MVAPHERDGDAARADLLQLGDGGKMFAGDDARILEPEIEEIARENEVISGPGDLLEKRVERFGDGGRTLPQARLRGGAHPGGLYTTGGRGGRGGGHARARSRRRR